MKKPVDNAAKRSPDKNQGCKKYGIAITDFVLGEKMDIPKEELLKHIKK